MSESNEQDAVPPAKVPRGEDSPAEDSSVAPEATEPLSPRAEVSADADPSPAGEGLGARSQRWLSRLDGWRQRLQHPWRSGDTLVELATSVRRDLEASLQPLGGGRRLFPFAGARLVLLPQSAEQESLFRAAAGEGWEDQLREAALEQLRAAGAELAELDLTVVVEVAASTEAAGASPPVAEPSASPVLYRLELLPYQDRNDAGVAASGSAAAAGTGPDVLAAEQPVASAGEAPVLRLVVEEGSASEACFQFHAQRVALGRLAEVFDQHGRIRRRNDVAFDDDGEINSTVSREHAQILFRADSNDYWLIDDRSSYGTRIFRAGRAIEVSSRDRRGIRLRSGDQIYLGRAVLRAHLE